MLRASQGRLRWIGRPTINRRRDDKSMRTSELILGVSALLSTVLVPVLLILVLRTRALIRARQRDLALPDARVIVSDALASYLETARQLEEALSNKRRLLDAEARGEVDSRLAALGRASYTVKRAYDLHVERLSSLTRRNRDGGVYLHLMCAIHNRQSLEGVANAIAALTQQEEALKSRIESALSAKNATGD